MIQISKEISSIPSCKFVKKKKFPHCILLNSLHSQKVYFLHYPSLFSRVVDTLIHELFKCAFCLLNYEQEKVMSLRNPQTQSRYTQIRNWSGNLKRLHLPLCLKKTGQFVLLLCRELKVLLQEVGVSFSGLCKEIYLLMVQS